MTWYDAPSPASLGRFALSPPAEGQYVVVATRVGYRTTRSPLFALGTSGSSTFDILMTAEPVGLAGFEVSVAREADELLRSYGVTPEILGQRWIGRRELEEMPLPRGPREAIRWRAIPGVWVDDHVAEVGAASRLCVTFRRGRRWGGSEVCAVILLNGVEISRGEAQQIDPGHLEAIAVLTPVEATAFYGTGAGGGMVLMWTRRGGR